MGIKECHSSSTSPRGRSRSRTPQSSASQPLLVVVGMLYIVLLFELKWSETITRLRQKGRFFLSLLYSAFYHSLICSLWFLNSPAWNVFYWANFGLLEQQRECHRLWMAALGAAFEIQILRTPEYRTVQNWWVPSHKYLRLVPTTSIRSRGRKCHYVTKSTVKPNHSKSRNRTGGAGTLANGSAMENLRPRHDALMKVNISSVMVVVHLRWSASTSATPGSQSKPRPLY